MADYNDYAAKIAAAMGTPDLIDELIEEHESTKIADYLSNERNRQGLSLREVAKRMGVSASKVCRFEDSYDKDLNYADIMAYGKALGVSPELTFTNLSDSKAMRSESLVYKIADMLEALKQLIPDPERIQSAIDDFSGRVLFPVLRSNRI